MNGESFGLSRVVNKGQSAGVRESVGADDGDNSKLLRGTGLEKDKGLRQVVGTVVGGRDEGREGFDVVGQGVTFGGVVS